MKTQYTEDIEAEKDRLDAMEYRADDLVKMDREQRGDMLTTGSGVATAFRNAVTGRPYILMTETPSELCVLLRAFGIPADCIDQEKFRRVIMTYDHSDETTYQEPT